MIHLKTLKKIPVEGHIRKTPGGGVTTVAPHLSNRKVNIDDILESFQNKSRSLREKLFDKNEKLKVDGDTAVHEIIDELYKVNGNGAESDDIKVEPYGMNKILNQAAEIFPRFEDLDMKKKYTTEGVALLLTNPNFINQSHKRVKKIKDKFIEAGVEVGDQIDPFSFNISAEVQHNLTISRLSDLYSADRGIYSNLGILPIKHEEILSDPWTNTFSIEHRSFKALMNFGKDRKLTSSILPSIILPNLIDSRNTFNNKYLKSLPASGDPFLSVMNSLDTVFRKDLNDYGFVYGNGLDNKRKALDLLKKVKTEKNGGEELYKFFSDIDEGMFNIALNHVLISGVMPLYLKTPEGKNLVGDVKKISERIRGLTEGEINSKKRINLTVSKNPISILSMSPRNSIISCQTITNKSGNAIYLTDLNANIPAAFNNHRTNDFIIFKNNRDNQKGARVSVNLDSRDDKFRVFEDSPIYGSHKAGREELDSLMYKLKQEEQLKEGFQWEDLDEINVDRALRVTLPALRTMHDIFNDVNNNPKAAAKYKDKIDTIQSEEIEKQHTKDFIESIYKTINRNIKLSGESMLYNSQIPGFLSGDDHLKEYKKNISGTTISQQKMKEFINNSLKRK